MRTGWTWHARAPPADRIRTMIRKLLSAVFASVFAVFAFVFAVCAQSVPRPPVIKITPDAGSAAPDGYAPIPEWLGQRRYHFFLSSNFGPFSNVGAKSARLVASAG